MAAGIKGAKELDAKLAALGAVVGGRVLRGALRSALNVAKAQAEADAAQLNESGRTHRTYRGRLVAPGFASRNLRVVVVRDKKTGAPLRAVLGVRREAFYAVQFIELGVESRGIPARPWLAPALERTQAAVTDKLADGIRRGIKRAAKK